MSDRESPDPLARLGQQLDRARAEQGLGPRRGDDAPPAGLGQGFRIGIELVAALVVGLVLGWVAFHFLPAPWGAIGFIGFIFLGVGAGIANVFRASRGIGYGPSGPPR